MHLSAYSIPGIVELSAYIESLEEFYLDLCKKLNVTDKEIKSSVRKRKLVGCRKIIAYILLKKKPTLEQVGKLMNRNHSTIIHYRDCVLSWDKTFNDEIKLLKKIENEYSAH